MNKTKRTISGKKAYVSPVSYCLKVNSSIICASETTVTDTGNHNDGFYGGALDELTTFSGGAGSTN